MSDTPARPNLAPIAVAAGCALFTMTLLYIIGGANLGLFFGGVCVVTLLLPPLVLQRDGWLEQAFIATAIHDSVGFVWLVAVVSPQINLMQWLACYLLLAAYCLALWALVRALRATRLHRILASTGATAIALLWLSWPIWMPARWLDFAARWLVHSHPLFAINGVLKHLGTWTERPLAYNHLMALGQDVPYTLPANVLPCVVVHLAAAAVFFTISWMRRSPAIIGVRSESP